MPAQRNADALLHRLNMYRRNLLEDETAAKRHWMSSQEEGKNPGTYEEFLAAVKKESNDFCATMEEFRQEENAYLELHPELAAINQEQANMFLCTVRAEDFQKLPHGIVMEKISEEIQEGHLLKDCNFAVQDYIAKYPAFPCPLKIPRSVSHRPILRQTRQ